jgi:hypothetical protein
MSSLSSVTYTLSHQVYWWFTNMLQNVSESPMFKIKNFLWVGIWNRCTKLNRPRNAHFNARITGVSTLFSLVQTCNDWNVNNKFYKFEVLTTMFLTSQAFRNVQQPKFFRGFNLQQISACIKIGGLLPCSTNLTLLLSSYIGFRTTVLYRRYYVNYKV